MTSRHPGAKGGVVWASYGIERTGVQSSTSGRGLAPLTGAATDW